MVQRSRRVRIASSLLILSTTLGLFQNCEELSAAKGQTAARSTASAQDTNGSFYPNSIRPANTTGSPYPGLDIRGVNGVSTIPVVPTDAPYPDIFSSLNVQNIVTGATPKLENWMVNLGMYTENQDPSVTSVGQYIGTAMGPGSARQWTFNTNMLRGASGIKGEYGKPNMVPKEHASINFELDYSNADQDCFQFPCFNVGLYIHNQGLFKSNNAIFLDATNFNGDKSKKMWHEGLTMYGPNLNDYSDINLITNAERGLKVSGNKIFGIEIDASARNNAIFIHDPPANEWPVGGSVIAESRTASAVSDISILTSSNVGLSVEGTHPTAAIRDSSRAPAAIWLNGEYSTAAISTLNSKISNNVAMVVAAGQQICFSGLNNCVSVGADGKMIYSVNNTQVFTVDQQGNATFKGTVKGSNIP